ncbi:MAG: Gfo/Idh/MocA family oxidoreductase, partial [Cyclobacteriaceae bacterium]|nr:Gfo/Idh/MocA family oxidoreductase [Cyclobacteriaceae bacterium]
KFLSLSRFSGLPAWGQWKEKQEQFGSSGGALFDLLIHDIDYAHYLLGMPDKIESTILPGSLSRHDYVSAFWTYPETTVKIEGGNTFHTGFPFQAGFMATFEMASVHYTTLKPDIIHLSENGATSEVATGVGPDGFYKEIDYFYQCLENGEQPTKCMPQSALDTIRLCYRHID